MSVRDPYNLQIIVQRVLFSSYVGYLCLGKNTSYFLNNKTFFSQWTKHQEMKSTKMQLVSIEFYQINAHISLSSNNTHNHMKKPVDALANT